MELRDESDETLMMRYASGDTAGFETLYLRHRPALFRFILRQVHDRAVSEEVFQEVWLAVIRARHRYRARARFTTMLYRIARSRIIDTSRASSRRRRGLGVAATQSPDDLPSPASVERAVDGERSVERLMTLVEALPAKQREAFLLREEAGLDVEAIAEITGVGRETARSRLRYAVARLRDGLGQEEPA